ncbi:transposase [Streptomyces sp. NPDC059805]|uniref:transposase n=1 Tax=Streptomyces sp. NPDC059805 TaxID=3346954 RepID=UPI0036478CC1
MSLVARGAWRVARGAWRVARGASEGVVGGLGDLLPDRIVRGVVADRRKKGSKHHLICDGRGTPLKVITTAVNVNDVTQTLALVDGVPPVAGRPGRPRRRPEALLGDKG